VLTVEQCYTILSVEPINEVMTMETSELLKLIAAFETDDNRYYHGDIRADTIQALKELVELREKIDEVKDVLK